MAKIKIDQDIKLKNRTKTLIYLCLSIFLLLTGCVTDNGLLYFEDGKAKLFDFVFFVDNEELSNTRVDFAYADLKKNVISNSNGLVSLGFSSEELLKLSYIYFEENIFLSDYQDRLTETDFLTRNIIEISVTDVKNNLFLPLSILNNSKNREIMIWIIKDCDKEFFEIAYEKDKNVSVRFELKYSELVNSREFVDYVLDIERCFFGIPVIEDIEFLEDYSIISGKFPGIDTPEVYIDDTSELVIMWDTDEILASNNNKDGKKIIVRQGFFESNFECGMSNVEEDKSNVEFGMSNLEEEKSNVELEQAELDNKELIINIEKLEEQGDEKNNVEWRMLNVELVEYNTEEIETDNILKLENENAIVEDSTEEVKLDSGSETYRNDREQAELTNEEYDQAKLDNEQLIIKNEKLEDQEIEDNGTMEIELTSGSETYRNDSEHAELTNEEYDQARLDNEELIIKNEEFLDKDTEDNGTMEIELDSGSEAYRNDTEEKVLNYSEELKEYFGEDSYEVVYLRDKVIDIAEINTVIIIDDNYYYYKVYDVEKEIYTMFELFFNKELEVEKNIVLIIKDDIKVLKIKPISDKYIEISYENGEKTYKKIVKKKIERVKSEK